MLGLLGLIFMAGAGIKQGMDMQYVADSNRANAIAEGRIYYRNARGDCFLVKGGQQVWLKNKYGCQILEDKNGRIVYNLTQMKKDEQTLKAIEMGRVKAEELGITDRNWLWVKKELGWNSYKQDERFDLTTGKRFTVNAYCYIKRSGTLLGKWSSKDLCHYHRIFMLPKTQYGCEDPITLIRKCTFSPVMGFFKENSDRMSDSAFIHISINYEMMYGVTKISLTEYLMEWNGTLGEDVAKFLIEIGIIKMNEVRWEELKQTDYSIYGDRPVRINPDDIVSIDEEKFREISKKLDSLFVGKTGEFEDCSAVYEYKPVVKVF